MSEAWAALVDDLEAESGVLEALLARLPPDAWDASSPAEGWTLRDCVVHLAETDDRAMRSVLSEAPAADSSPPDGVLTDAMLGAQGKTPSEVFDWYCRANQRLVSALRRLGGEERLSWAGRPMSARSFTSARLMEHWSHGLDIHDAAGVAPVDTDRLRQVAHLGYLTRDFAYRTHAMTPPETSLYLELVAPSGETWVWGPPDAPDRISGTAGDFCRVVTQRIHPVDTSLHAEGPHAAEFLSIAQAFAGPPGSGRPPRSSPKA